MSAAQHPCQKHRKTGVRRQITKKESPGAEKQWKKEEETTVNCTGAVDVATRGWMRSIAAARSL
jgi:hypothetical protein